MDKTTSNRAWKSNSNNRQYKRISRKNSRKVDDPNMELLRWAEIMTLVQDVYSKPFVVPEDEWNKYVDKASQITKDVLIDSIVNYIYDNNLTSFRLSWISQEPIFVTYCEYILRHQYYEDPTDDLISVLLKRSLSELVNENFLTFADKKTLLYEVKGEYVDYNN
ncbi:3869_t:CDS:2 [Diversispora eburnea]|uniref:3869_t:CDS:1 n=1 Tax=Diversispora eburnea TaxID=1213867 RepID=A0A9N8VY93_9GLOM|nr:3869_t:CDS:2 [Diversispora eburnea]